MNESVAELSVSIKFEIWMSEYSLTLLTNYKAYR